MSGRRISTITGLMDILGCSWADASMIVIAAGREGYSLFGVAR